VGRGLLFEKMIDNNPHSQRLAKSKELGVGMDDLRSDLANLKE